MGQKLGREGGEEKEQGKNGRRAGTGPLVLLPSPVVSGRLLTPVSTMYSVILIIPRTQGREAQAVAAVP